MAHPDRPCVHLITDPRFPRDALLRAIRAAAGEGIDWVQVRDPLAPARELARLAEEIIAICRPHGVRVAINDRLDVALAIGADGVQLGHRSLSVAQARPIAGRLEIGASVHDLPSAIQAAREGADWLTFGHLFPTSSHPGEEPRGLLALSSVVAAVPIPVIGIGGVTARNARAVIEAGARGIAVITAILAAPDPAATTAALRRALSQPASPPEAG